MVSLKVWVVGGLILAAPVLIYELWAFVGAGVHGTREEYFYPVVFATTALFLGGVAFAYLLVLPKGLPFLLTFSAGYFNVQNCAPATTSPSWRCSCSPSAWCSSCRWSSCCSPRSGVIDDKFLRKNRRCAILIMAVRRGRHHAQPGRLLDARHVRAALCPLRGLHRRSPASCSRRGRPTPAVEDSPPADRRRLRSRAPVRERGAEAPLRPLSGTMRSHG